MTSLCLSLKCVCVCMYVCVCVHLLVRVCYGFCSSPPSSICNQVSQEPLTGLRSFFFPSHFNSFWILFSSNGFASPNLPFLSDVRHPSPPQWPHTLLPMSVCEMATSLYVFLISQLVRSLAERLSCLVLNTSLYASLVAQSRSWQGRLI